LLQGQKSRERPFTLADSREGGRQMQNLVATLIELLSQRHTDRGHRRLSPTVWIYQSAYAVSLWRAEEQMCIRFSVNSRAEIPRRSRNARFASNKDEPANSMLRSRSESPCTDMHANPFCGIDYARGKLLRHSRAALIIHNDPGVDMRHNGIGVKRYV
jgi:hypothetical protein